MTLPEQSDRAVKQTRAFLLRLASPYVEHGIKGIRKEVRAEALALLRHYPYSYVGSDEKRGYGDMSGATMARLSQKCDCPAPDNAAIQDILTDEELEDIRMWRTECQRQCGAATAGNDSDAAERWSGRAARAAALLERLGGEQ